MNLTASLTSCFVLYIFYTTIISVTYSKEISKHLENTDSGDLSLRNKRDLVDFDDLPAEEKRQRDFVGKRAREFVGKRAREFVGKRTREFVGKRSSGLEDYDMEEFYPNLYQNDKRMRDFIGKRSMEDIYSEKRMRDFVGKRGLENDYIMDKRLRDFVGKRTIPDDLPEMDKRQREVIGLGDDDLETGEELDNFEKRIRELVGKRSVMDKRIRELIGKRLNFDSMYPVYFVRKPKYVRELIGKRSYPSSDDDTYSLQEKRMRDFVGK